MSSAFSGPKLTDRRCRLLTGLTGGGAATDRVFRASKSKGKGSTVDGAANGVLMFRMRNGSGLTSNGIATDVPCVVAGSRVVYELDASDTESEGAKGKSQY